MTKSHKLPSRLERGGRSFEVEERNLNEGLHRKEKGGTPAIEGMSNLSYGGREIVIS